MSRQSEEIRFYGAGGREIVVDEGAVDAAGDVVTVVNVASSGNDGDIVVEHVADINHGQIHAQALSPSSALPDIGNIDLDHNEPETMDEDIMDTTDGIHAGEIVTGVATVAGSSAEGDTVMQHGGTESNYGYNVVEIKHRAAKLLKELHPMMDMDISVLSSDETCETALSRLRNEAQQRAHPVRFEVFDGSTFYGARKFLHRFAKTEDAMRRFGRELTEAELEVEDVEGKLVLQTAPCIPAIYGEDVTYEADKVEGM